MSHLRPVAAGPPGSDPAGGQGNTVAGKVRTGGRSEFLPGMQYAASAYSNPIRMLFGRINRFNGALKPKEGFASVLICRTTSGSVGGTLTKWTI